MSNATSHVLLLKERHPDIFQIWQKFEDFLQVVSDDLSKKLSDLKEQRQIIPNKHSPVKNYLSCQIYMLGKHQKRVERFRQEADRQVAAILNATDSDWEKSQTKLTCDIDKMKRRCKHILDVTDRFCVLKLEELKLKPEELEKHKPEMDMVDAGSISSLSEDSHDSSEVSYQTSSSCESTSDHSFPSDRQLTQNLVKSTFESFGCHLAVLTKTYTNRKAHHFTIS